MEKLIFAQFYILLWCIVFPSANTEVKI